MNKKKAKRTSNSEITATEKDVNIIHVSFINNNLLCFFFNVKEISFLRL